MRRFERLHDLDINLWTLLGNAIFTEIDAKDGDDEDHEQARRKHDALAERLTGLLTERNELRAALVRLVDDLALDAVSGLASPDARIRFSRYCRDARAVLVKWKEKPRELPPAPA